MSNDPTQPILAPTFCFRFSVDCRRADGAWSSAGADLPESHRLPTFGELEGRPAFADLRAGWNPRELLFRVVVAGKKQPPWCRESRADESDGLRLWIDTRNVHDSHRASRFCHHYNLLPMGGGPRKDQPLFDAPPIRRAKQIAKAAPAGSIELINTPRRDGYDLSVRVDAKALHGYDTEEHPRLGFTYAVIDRELGWQTFTVGPEFSFQDDPSLWGELALTS